MFGSWGVPIVSIVVPFLGLPLRILNRDSVKPKEGTTMETRGSALGSTGRGLVLASPSRNSETKGREVGFSLRCDTHHPKP